MRAPLAAGLAVALLAPLAGCLQGDTGGTTTPSTFTATCPNWTRGDHPIFSIADTSLYIGGAGQAAKTSVNLIPDPPRAPADEGGKRADGYALDFPRPNSYSIHVENGTLEFRAYRNDTGEHLRLHEPTDPQDARLAWTFPNGYTGGAHLQVNLVPATQDPSPAPLRLEATFTALPGHVIGTGKEGPNSRAGATFSLDATVLYRAAGCRAA